MAAGVCNASKGKINEYAARVNANDPADAVLVLALFIGSGATDDDYTDADTFSAIEALQTAEVTDPSYGRIILDDTAIGATTIDDGANSQSFDIADQTWTALSGGDSVTKLVVGFDADSTSGTDADIIPCTHHDFVLLTNGSDVVAQSPSGLWSAT